MSVEINAPATLTSPGGNISFNPSSPSTDYYWLTNLAGLAQAPLRVSLDDKPQAHGAIIHPFWRGARHITIDGLVVGSSVASRNTLMDALQGALEAIEQANGSWSWTPTGGTLKTVTVRCDVPIDFSGGQGGGPKAFTFGLVAANPAIT